MKITNLTDKITELYRDHIVNELRILHTRTIVAAVSDPREGGVGHIIQPKETEAEGAWVAALAMKEFGWDSTPPVKVAEDDVFTYYTVPLPHL